MSAAKTVKVTPKVFEDIRKSADSLPADGDELTLNEDVFDEIALCAWSHEAAAFARRYRRYGSVKLVNQPSIECW